MALLYHKLVGDGGKSGVFRQSLISLFWARKKPEQTISRVLFPRKPRRAFTGNGHSAGTAVARRLVRPTREHKDGPPSGEPEGSRRSLIWSCTGWGLPCRCSRLQRGELLPRLFTLTPRGAVCFLWHFPWGCPRSPLATTLPCGARTFLRSAHGSRRPFSLLRQEQLLRIYRRLSRKARSALHAYDLKRLSAGSCKQGGKKPATNLK